MTRTEVILGLCYLLFEIFALGFVLALIFDLLRKPVSDVIQNFIFFACNFLFTTLFFHRYLIENGKLALESPAQCLRAALIGFMAYWAMSYVLSFIIIWFFPNFYNVNDESISTLFVDNYPLMAIGSVILAPVAEELLHRGLIFGQLYNKNRFLAYLISTVAFSALHIVNYIGLYSPLHLFICFLQYVPASLCLGWAYAKADSIWAPIMIHIAINQIATTSVR